MKKASVCLLTSLLFFLVVLSTNIFAEEVKTDASDTIGVTYRTHIENEGWRQGWMADGFSSGSEGKGLRLEGIEIELTGTVPDGIEIQYQTHLENNGWTQGWVSAGELSGSVGDGLRLEAIEIKLIGKNSADYTVRYRTHIQNDGWKQGWVADGTLSGSEGKGLRLEAIEIVIEKTPLKIAFDKYLAVLDQAKEADYTIVTWKAYQKVVDANIVTKDDIVNDITVATTAIEKAQADLVKKADLTIYNDVLDNAAEADCTAESWKIYQAVVAANVVTGEDTQAKVDAATIAIMKAQKSLVKFADMTEYTAALAAVKEDQVKSGWAAYKTVVDANVVAKTNTQAEVDAATTAILTAQKKLLLYSDLTAFNKAIEQYVTYGADAANAPYTAATWTVYVSRCENYGTLTAGKWVYDTISKDTAQTTIDAAAADLNVYIANLVKTADLTAYNTAKNIKISDGPYTTVSFTSYTSNVQVQAITSISAETLKSYSQSVVDGYTNTLLALQQGILVLGSNLANYNTALAAVKETNYTPVSWSGYQGIVTANVVTADSTQAAVDVATGKIVEAQKNLVYTSAYVIANAKINSTNFVNKKVGDNVLIIAKDLMTAAGIDKTDYTVTFARVDAGSAVINSTTGVITDRGTGIATFTFNIAPIDGAATATTANVEIQINP